MINKNIIYIVVGIIILFIVYNMMKTSKAQNAILQSHSDILMAVALKTGAIVPSKKENTVVSKKEKSPNASKPIDTPPVTKKTPILNAAQKRIVKLFDDETPKTAAQLRELYNKVNTPVNTKQFNNLLFNLMNNKGVINKEAFEDSDSAWGLIEWFDGEKLTDEYFNRIVKSKKA